jgi:hypothetical protein
MKKLLEDHRKTIGNFEVIEFQDQAEVARLRDRVDTGVPLEIHWTWEYGSEVEELRRLYDKGKVSQWNADTDLDWSLPVSKDDWVLNPQASLMAQACQMMGKDEETQKAAAFDELAFTISQLLHGEQAALQLCGQLVNVCDKMDQKWYAASQVIDEARHVEVLSKFLQRKMGTIYPIGATLKVLLDELLEVEGMQKKTLGMQTLFEGTAVGIMDMMRSESRNPFFTEMIRRAGRGAPRGLRRAHHATRGEGSHRGRARGDGGLGVFDPRGPQRQPAARHAPGAGPQVRHRWGEPGAGHDEPAQLRGAEQPGLHAHRGAEPPAPRSHHRAHEKGWRDAAMMVDQRGGNPSAELPLVS